MLDLSIDWSTISELEEQSEGWVTGLRLAALAIRHRIGDDSFQVAISGHNRYVTEYLISEILTKQAATLSNCMLKTSILDRFCADLCEAVCSKAEKLSGDGSGGPEFNGAQFLEWLQASNLFVIPLDNSNKWFRYHHLFREFLQQELIRRLTPDRLKNCMSLRVAGMPTMASLRRHSNIYC